MQKITKKEVIRDHKIELRVSFEEKETIKKNADSRNMNLSTFIRECSLNDNVIFIEKSDSEDSYESENSTINEEKRMLYGLANNLNQLTKFSHQKKVLHAELEGLVHSIKDIILARY